MRAAGERDLGAGDRPDTEVLRGVRELERAVDTVVVGERERLVAELGSPRGQLLRLRRTVEERVRRMRVQLDVAAGGDRSRPRLPERSGSRSSPTPPRAGKASRDANVTASSTRAGCIHNALRQAGTVLSGTFAL